MLGSKEVHHLLVTIIDNVLHRSNNLCRQFHLAVLKIFIIQEEVWLGQLEPPHQRSGRGGVPAQPVHKCHSQNDNLTWKSE